MSVLHNRSMIPMVVSTECGSCKETERFQLLDEIHTQSAILSLLPIVDKCCEHSFQITEYKYSRFENKCHALSYLKCYLSCKSRTDNVIVL